MTLRFRTTHVRDLLVCVALLAAFFVPGPTVEARVSASKTYRDRNHKFSMKMLDGFEQVPLKIDEQNVVAKFRDPKAKGQMRGSINTEINVFRIKKQAGPVVTGTAAPQRRRRQMTYTDSYQAVAHYMSRYRVKLAGTREDFKAIKSKDKPKIPGKLYTFEPKVQGMRGQELELFVMLGVYEKDGVEIGIMCLGGSRKKLESAFKRICTHFKWFDKRSDDVESRDELDGVNITARKRVQIESSIVEGWDLIVSKKGNYIVLYNTANNRNNSLARIIAERIEKIREQIYEKQFPPSEPITTVCIVRVCKDKREYHAYGGPGGSAGYWSSGDEELVFYDASPSKKIDDNTLAVLYHEAFHQYIYYSVGNVAPHSWFNEGHGDYYAGAEYSGGKFKIKPFQWRIGTIKNAIVKGPRALRDPDGESDEDADANPRPGPMGRRGRPGKYLNDGGYTPLEDLVRFTQGEYYSYAGICYAQGWSLIYFLREIVPKNKKYKAKWGHILDTYFDTLKAEVNSTGKLVPMGRFKDDGETDDDDAGKKDAEKKEADDSKGDDDTGDDDTGDDDTGDDDTGDGGDGEKEEELGIAPPSFGGMGSGSALNRAIQAAFKGIDWPEFEAAWIKGTKKGK